MNTVSPDTGQLRPFGLIFDWVLPIHCRGRRCGFICWVLKMFFSSKLRASSAGTCALAISVFAPFPTHAQVTEVLPEMVVTATKVPQRAESVLADVSVIDREAIDRSGATTIGDLLDSLPGIEVVVYGQAGIYVRGADPRAVAVFVDGVRIDYQDKNGGGARLGEIPLAIVEKIEVVRGPLSGLYGANAMAGVIQIFTLSPDRGSYKTLEFGLGSHGLRHSVFSLQSETDQGVRLGVSGTLRSGDGYDSKPDLANTPANLAFKERSLKLGVDLPLNATDKLGFVTLATHNGGDYVDQYASRFPNNDHTDHKNTHTAFNWQRNWRTDLKGTLSLTSSRMATVSTLPDSYTNRTSAIAYDLTLQSKDAVVSGGLERKYDRLAAQADVYNSEVFRGKGQNAIYLGYGSSGPRESFQGNIRFEDDDTYGSNHALGLSYGIPLGDQWRVTLGTSTGFRAPTVEQIYGIYGSASIKPETSVSKEIAFRYKGQRSAGAIVIYGTKFTDKFGYDSNFNHTNVAKASVEGITLSGKARWEMLDVSASIDLMDPRDDTTGKLLNLRAKKSAALSVSSRYNQWTSGATVRLRGPRYHEATNTNLLPGDALLDLSSERQIDNAWSVKVRVSNALNKSYRDQKEDAAPGRQFYVGLIWRD